MASTNRFINKVCSNTKTDFIEITEDKLENILIYFIQDLRMASGWLTPFSIFITILITILTADFKEFLSISKDIWTAMFYVVLFLSFCWLVYGVINAIRKRNKIQVKYLINKIKYN